MANYGKFVSTPDSPGLGTINSGTARATIYRPMTENGWGYLVGGHVGKHPSDGSPVWRYGVNLANSGSPGERVGYTEQLTTNTNMDNGGAGVRVSGSFVETTQAYSPLDTALALYDGDRYSICALPTGGNRLQHGMYPAATISEAYEDFYEQTGLSIPPDPFNETSATNQGWETFWIVYDPETPPAVPVNRTPAGTITDTTPTMEGDFRSDQGRFGTDRGDRMSKFQIQVRPVGWTSSTYWDSTQDATQSEKDNDRFSTTYAGTALVAGGNYEWRCRVRNHFGTWGSWSSWLGFDIPATGTSSPGVLTLNGTPTGKQEAITGLTFQGRYTHSDGLSMDRVQVRIYEGGTLVYTSGEITKSVASSSAPGTLFNVTQAEIGVTLQWGGNYDYTMRGRTASNGLWSSYTAKRSFNTNAKPNKPENLDPTGSEGVVPYPILSMTMTDADDSVATGLVAFADILSLLAVNNPSFNGNVTNWAAVFAAGVTASFTYDSGQNQDGVGGSGKVNISASTAGSGVLVARARNDRVYPVVVGESYAVEGYVRSDQLNLRPGMFIDWFSDTGGTTLISTSEACSAVAAINTWEYRTITATAPASALTMKVGFAVKSNAANQLGNVWGDAVSTSLYEPRYRRSMTYIANGVWNYQTTSTDLPANGTYKWSAYGNDGTVSGDRSSESTFILSTGPVVTMTAPTANQVLTTSTPTITWTTTDQQKFEVFIYENLDPVTGVTGALLFDSGEVVSGTSSYIMPSGVLHNGEYYRVKVKVWNSVAQEGTSANRDFSIDYGPVTPITNVFASGYSMMFDPCPSGILITWDESFYPASEHEAYGIYRREATQPTSYNLMIGRLTNVGQTSFLDFHPASGVEYIYTVTQLVKVGTDVIESVGTVVQTSVTLCATVLSAADDGDTYRVVAEFWSDRGMEVNTDGENITAWGASKPTTFFGSAYFQTIRFTARFVNTYYATIQQISKASNDLLARRAIVCFRDPKGRKVFGVLSKIEEQDEAMGTLRAITYELTETNYTEAV
jgi:hypothetical protein